jgi:subtilisin family serine protease
MKRSLWSGLAGGFLGISLALAGCNATPGSGFDDGETAINALGNAAMGKMVIVTLRDGVDVDSALDDLALAQGAGVTHRYRHAMKGGALLVPNAAAAAALAGDPRVLRVEDDQPIEAIGKPGGGGSTQPPQTAPTGYRLIGAEQSANEGAGAYVAVIDTGVLATHPDLAANVDKSLGKDCVNEPNQIPTNDANGHGTHVAGTIAAVNNTIGSIGVGTAIKIIPVKVLNKRGSGSWSSIICGIDHVTSLAGSLPLVANMSLGGSGSDTASSLRTAIDASVAAGVPYAVAAGNESDDAANHVPSSYDSVITVSAYQDLNGTIDAEDTWAYFTNYGADVDIAAPGRNIYSTWLSNGYNTISGTSMASPHVAAAAAMYLSTHPGASPGAVKAALQAAAVDIRSDLLDEKHQEKLLSVAGGFPASP